MIVTFYSFKGGVGRSMALANVGELLADLGYRVVVCDWDLEAPGLERYFVNGTTEADLQSEMSVFVARPGVMDLLVDYKETLTLPLGDPAAAQDKATHTQVGKLLLRRPFSYAEPVPRERSGAGWLRLLTAGRRDGEFFQRYAEEVRRFDWEEFYSRWAGDAYIDFFRQDLAGDPRNGIPGEADVVLVDSRTGVTEQGGVCTHHLADLVVLVTAANDLNMDGSRWMASALADERLTKVRGGRPLQVLPVASRIEQTAQKEELAAFRDRFVQDFREPILKAVGDPERFALDSEIPYIPFYSFHERIVAREPEGQRDKRLYAAYRTLAEGVVRYGLRSGLLREPASQGRVLSTPSQRSVAATAPQGWDEEDFLERLEGAVKSFDLAAAERLCDELIAHLENTDEACSERQALTVLRILRRKRYFDLMQRTAEAVIDAGQTSPSIRRLHAQALIEKGDLTAALSHLQLLLSETGDDPMENAEARGLIGRIYKQQYVHAADPSSQRGRRHLERAVNAYYELYLSSDRTAFWNGINTVALVMRGRRDGLTIEGFPEPEAMATEILSALESRDFDGQIASWDFATAAEACLALGRHDEALRWIVRYVKSPEVDAFELADTLSQITEVWQLDPGSSPGATILPVLRSQLLQRSGGQGSFGAQEIVAEPDKRLEKILGSTGFETLQWYQTGAERSRAVARVETRDGQPVGSGFLMRGRDLHPSLADEFLLVTCASVLSDDPNLKSSIRSQEARVTFEALGADKPGEISEIVWSSPPDRLDTTIALLAPPITEAPVYPIAARLPVLNGSERVYIIGHPGGRTLSFSLSDNVLLDWEDPWIHYRAPTESGSSGSPVFNHLWNLIGVHHAGGLNLRRLNGQEGTYAANEGIWIQAILRQLGQDLHTSSEAATKKRRQRPSSSS